MANFGHQNFFYMLKRILLAVILLPFTALSQDYPQNYFSAPLDIPLLLSGSFGELRSNHFHSGIDIKTQGVVGFSVFAPADGQVVRIKISATGFGNAIYMAHPNGYTTVYGHLQSIDAPMAAWVKEQQYAQKSFEVDLFPSAGKFTYKKGSIIAKTGNTGGSGGPHLHFEIRDSRTEKTINPALFGFAIQDTRKPVIANVYAVPLQNGSLVDGAARTKQLALTSQGNGSYTTSFTAGGSIGLQINTFDQQSLSDNHNGIYEIEQFVNDTLVYVFKITQFAFDESRYINAHIDYERFALSKQRTHKTYVEAGNFLSLYPTLKNRGTISLAPNQTKTIKILVRDSWGNQSQVLIMANGQASEVAPPDTGLMNFEIANTIKLDGFKVSIPAKTLYKTERVALQKTNACSSCASETFKIGQTTIAAHGRYTISIHKSQLTQTEKVVWATLDGRPSGLTSTWEGAYLIAKPRSFGSFAVLQDLEAPKLNVQNFAQGKIVKPGNRIRFTATDNLSGITKYTANIDGTWVLVQHDAKNNLYWHDFEADLKPGTHTLTILLQDEVGNKTSQQIVFTYQP